MTELRFTTPEWSAPANIRAVTTTRNGGVSGPPYMSLNLGAHVGDSTENIQHNRRVLAENLQLPEQPSWLNQVHGTEVIEIQPNQRFEIPPDADAAIARSTGTVCAVMTADCLPLILCNRQGSCIAAIHAGWRGMAAGIIEQTLSALGEEPDNIIAWAGPTIGPESFEVGPEVPEQLGGSELAYQPAGRSGKYYANLYMLAGERLAEAGVSDYSHSQACTLRDADELFLLSPRRPMRTHGYPDLDD